MLPKPRKPTEREIRSSDGYVPGQVRLSVKLCKRKALVSQDAVITSAWEYRKNDSRFTSKDNDPCSLADGGSFTQWNRNRKTMTEFEIAVLRPVVFTVLFVRSRVINDTI